jgi:hypothetical protein
MNRGSKSKVRVGAVVATVAAVVGIATGVLTLRDQLFSDEASTDRSEQREISRYDGVAGHFAEGRALLDFLEQHNRQAVYLEVGFPAHMTGPAGGDNVQTRDKPFKGGTRPRLTGVALMTECESDIAPKT